MNLNLPNWIIVLKLLVELHQSRHSRKNTVTTNAYLLDSNFLSMTDEEKRDCWKWARQSSEVKEVRKIEADFLATVK